MDGAIWRLYKNTYACVWYFEKAPKVTEMRNTIMMGCKGLHWLRKATKPWAPQVGLTERERESRTMMIGRHKLAFPVRISPASPFFFFFREGYCLTVYKSQSKNKKNCLCSRTCLCWNAPLSNSSIVYFFLTRSWEFSYGTSHSKYRGHVFVTS